MQKSWKIKESRQISQEILKEAGSEILANILINRGIDTPLKIKNFLNPLKMSITSPDAFSDMRKSVERIKKAVDVGENITIYGDFDADGITSTAVLYKTLKQIGANVSFYIPDRETESHGLNTKALVKIISKNKAKLIITVDCAISDVAEVSFANGFGTDVIITDHHEAPDELPPAFAIINPKAKNSLVENLNIEEIEYLNYLAGVGVAFKLSCALLEEFSMQDYVNQLLPMVAVGTIADIVPLLGENRAFVTMGLSLIQKGAHLGIDTLLKIAGVEKIESATSETIAFSLAPRLNAAGRLDSAQKALAVLISDNEDEIRESAEYLNELNSERQILCDETYREAVSMIEKNEQEHKHCIVLFNEEWHIGVIGIVASKLIEKYNRPVFMMTKDSPESTQIRCSCRSIKGINVYDVLALHSDLFLGFGGHSMAAGFSFDEKIVVFEKFRGLLSKTIEEVAAGLDLRPFLDIDFVLSPENINHSFINELQKLQPFGAKNQPPLFVLKDLKLSQYKMMGQNANHLKMFVSGENSQVFECVKWNYPDFNLPINSKLDIAFYPKFNFFNGNTSIQLDLKDIQSEMLIKTNRQIKILDHRKKTNILNQVMDYLSTSTKKIALFVENKAVESEFFKYPELKDKVFSRLSIPSNYEQIMLFDCPSSKELMNKIVSKTNADTIHIMNFEPNFIAPDDFLKVFSGMLKYSDKNKDGIISVEELAKASKTTDKAINISLELFSELSMIDLEKLESGMYKISFKQPIELSKIKQHQLYADLKRELSDVSEFVKNMHLCDIAELQKILF